MDYDTSMNAGNGECKMGEDWASGSKCKCYSNSPDQDDGVEDEK